MNTLTTQHDLASSERRSCDRCRLDTRHPLKWHDLGSCHTREQAA